ncbi:MAG: C40 family peptidase [Oscillospiraceae bacterium]|nr:C40 family peptidase [Oscillospiraceae bacterium]
MKFFKFINKTFIFSVITAACLGSAALADDVIGTGVVEGQSLRLRSEASTDASIIAYLDNKTPVDVHEDLGDWFKVSCGDYTGYVSAEYLTYTPDTSTASSDTTSSDPAPRQFSNAGGSAGVITGIGVNFRAEPSMDGAIINNLPLSSAITVMEVLDSGWCEVSWNGETGYIKSDYVAVNGIPVVDPVGVITGSIVNLRAEPSTESSILTKLSSGTTVELNSLDGEWYSVVYNGMSGFVSADYIRIGSAPESIDAAAPSTIGSGVVDTAKKYLGTPYSYGGASSRGFDCSGFTMYVFSQHGYSLPHSATSQWNACSVSVSKSDLQPGDLVFFNDPARNAGKACSHVGIYVGDNQFIHSSSSRSGGVIISSLGESYYSTYYKGAKRVG